MLYKTLPILLLLTACNQTPKDDGTVPAPLFPQPQIVEVNPKGGYKINPTTGDSIKPLINFLGDTIPTGVPIPVKGKLIHSDSVAKPKVVKVPTLESLEKHNAHPNRHKLPENIPSIPVDENQLKTVKFGEGNQDFVLVNSTGDTLPTEVTIPVKRKVVKAIQPILTQALPPAFKDATSTNLQYLDVDQGMNSSYVLSILEDSRGNLWFGTDGGGVSKYDGESFFHYSEKEGLSSNYVWSIIEDSKGNLWFGTNGGGVSKYDGESFTHYTEKEGLGSNTVISILEDNKGDLWFGTSGAGVSKLTKSDVEGHNVESFTHYTEKEGLSNNYIWSIIEDSKGNLWFGTNGGGVSKLVKSDINGDSRESFTHYSEKEGLSSNHIRSIIEDSKGNLWFATYSGGVSKFDGKSFTNYSTNEGLSSSTVRSIIEDSKGNLWFGTSGGGVLKYDGESFTHYSEKEGLSSNYVWSIIEDSKGNLWFGTYGGGVSKYDDNSFFHYSKKNGLSSNYIWSVLEDSRKNIWYGTDGGGVSKYDGETFTHYSEKEGLSSSYVISIIEDSKENIWYGTDGGGVSKYDGESFTHYGEKEGLSSNYVWSIIEDSKGNLWFGTYGGGVSKYDGKSFTHYSEKEGLSSNYVWSIIEDSKGNLWFGTYGGGVSKYNGKSFIHYSENEGLNSNTVMSIIEDSKGNLWFGTDGGGVSKYDGESFTHYTEKEGLSSNYVWSIIEDSMENFWFGTEKGITLIKSDKEKKFQENNDKSKTSTQSFTVQRFTKQDGLKGLDFFMNSAFIDTKNRTWWGSGKSLTMLDLNKFKLSQNPPSVYLKQLDINEQFIDYSNISDSLSSEIQFSGVERFENYPHALNLPYDQNHLTFHFVGIDWNAPHKIQYSHRMLGLNNNWSNPTHEAKADYRNLPHGTYTFQIRAIGENGEWSESFEYIFTIHPPWWHTIYARAGYGILGIFLILGTVRWRTNKLKKRQIELETEVDLATKEIRDQKEVVEKQKEVVEEKNKEILDSINYAKRIQNAILPSQKLVKKYIPDSFILYKPKDVVAGDFYWMEQKDDKILFAAADCTGHGVPGAMVSVVCNNGLNRSVREHGLIDPGKILDKTRDVVISEFEKSEEDVQDGMDISLCTLDFKNQTLQWAGANNPLWIIRNGEILETKPDKQPIGVVDNPMPFTTHKIELQKGDTIYVFTDGFQDQFGGERGKKFKPANFKKLLLSICSEPMGKQLEIIDKTFEEWKGSLEQLDDLCVLGVRL